MRLKILLFLIYLFLIQPLFGEIFYIEEYNYSVFIPEGWKTLDSSNLKELSFVSDDQTVVFQISTYSGDKYSSAREMLYSLTNDLGVDIEGSSFLYNENDTIIADITFSTVDANLRGWFLCINREDRDYYLFAFCGESYYEEKFPFILSCLDSFRIEDTKYILFPGAVSQFYYPFPGNNNDTAQMIINGSLVSFQTDLNEFDASQTVIEREAEIMRYYQIEAEKQRHNHNTEAYERYTILFEKAWKRYYNVIFRDNYSRFANLAETLRNSNIGRNNREKAIILLDWIQKFKYTSSGTFSDLLSPISAVSKEEGDCDARGLAYSIMLKHLGIDSLLLVSWQYKHSLSAVDIEGDGARYPFENKTYLIGETTETVDIGMIPQSMSEGEKWIPVSFF